MLQPKTLLNLVIYVWNVVQTYNDSRIVIFTAIPNYLFVYYEDI